MSALAKASGVLKSVDYEVFGRVQGVCFRMYTEDEARKMGVVGWVKNTRQGTVTGQVQGPEDKVNAMWSTNDYSLLLLPITGVTLFTVVSADYAAVLEVQSSNPDDDAL
ncbi:acylphosphatase-2 isoform X1 [Mauremys reevesii]|nr:acylphosphatase-2 isoform X1 [Mauremys reevesii]XP_039386252.1 acylphosphatase-2 isoform X1 [Mauremys reevesii]